MTTIDEALALADSDQYATDPVAGTLSVEVERLRKCLEQTNTSMEAMERDLYLKLQGVEAENEQLRAELSAAKFAQETLVSELAQRNAENAVLTALDKGADQVREVRDNLIDQLLTSEAKIEALKAQLDWFEKREPWVRKHVDHCWFEKGEAVQDWEEENPRPPLEGTAPSIEVEMHHIPVLPVDPAHELVVDKLVNEAIERSSKGLT